MLNMKGKCLKDLFSHLAEPITPDFLAASQEIANAVMASKSTQKTDGKCFPWFGHRKDKKLSKTKSLEASKEQKTSESIPIERTRTRSTPSVSSDGIDEQSHQVYFSGKARVSFRHEMDSIISAAESTY